MIYMFHLCALIFWHAFFFSITIPLQVALSEFQTILRAHPDSQHTVPEATTALLQRCAETKKLTEDFAQEFKKKNHE